MTETSDREVASLPPVSELDRDTSRGWARDALWRAVASLFEAYREDQGLTYAALGRRIGRPRGQVQRWLDAPMNMTLSSAGLLAEGLDADLCIEVVPRGPVDLRRNRVCAPDAAESFVRAAPVTTSFADHRRPAEAKTMATPATAPFEWRQTVDA